MKEFLKRNRVLVGFIRKVRALKMTTLCKVSPRMTTKYLFRKHYKTRLNLDDPKLFNEKLNWLKLNTFDDLVIKCADKYEFRDYVKEKKCEEILPKLYGVYESVEEIEFELLPNNFVLKCTHGCGYNIICSDKSNLDIKKAKETLNSWMSEKYGYNTCELHYTKIKPKIICEEYLEDSFYDHLADYKIYCFNGKPMYTLVCSDREYTVKKAFYNLNWEKMDFRKDNCDLDFSKPQCYDEMLKYARILASPFYFVRVDFYNINNKPILGELTFTPAACLSTEYTKEAELFLGELIKLPN